MSGEVTIIPPERLPVRKRHPKRVVPKPFLSSLRRLTTANPDRIDRIMNKALTRAENGDFAFFKELVDRLDGRVAYKVGGDEDAPPIKLIITGVPRGGDDD